MHNITTALNACVTQLSQLVEQNCNMIDRFIEVDPIFETDDNEFNKNVTTPSHQKSLECSFVVKCRRAVEVQEELRRRIELILAMANTPLPSDVQMGASQVDDGDDDGASLNKLLSDLLSGVEGTMYDFCVSVFGLPPTESIIPSPAVKLMAEFNTCLPDPPTADSREKCSMGRLDPPTRDEKSSVVQDNVNNSISSSSSLFTADDVSSPEEGQDIELPPAETEIISLKSSDDDNETMVNPSKRKLLLDERDNSTCHFSPELLAEKENTDSQSQSQAHRSFAEDVSYGSQYTTWSVPQAKRSRLARQSLQSNSSSSIGSPDIGGNTQDAAAVLSMFANSSRAAPPS
jgi:hypothetical protein